MRADVKKLVPRDVEFFLCRKRPLILRLVVGGHEIRDEKENTFRHFVIGRIVRALRGLGLRIQRAVGRLRGCGLRRLLLIEKIFGLGASGSSSRYAARDSFTVICAAVQVAEHRLAGRTKSNAMVIRAKRLTRINFPEISVRLGPNPAISVNDRFVNP